MTQPHLEGWRTILANQYHNRFEGASSCVQANDERTTWPMYLRNESGAERYK